MQLFGYNVSVKKLRWPASLRLTVSRRLTTTIQHFFIFGTLRTTGEDYGERGFEAENIFISQHSSKPHVS
jgi:hypothetical protein